MTNNKGLSKYDVLKQNKEYLKSIGYSNINTFMYKTYVISIANKQSEQYAYTILAANTNSHLYYGVCNTYSEESLHCRYVPSFITTIRNVRYKEENINKLIKRIQRHLENKSNIDEIDKEAYKIFKVIHNILKATDTMNLGELMLTEFSAEDSLGDFKGAILLPESNDEHSSNTLTILNYRSINAVLLQVLPLKDTELAMLKRIYKYDRIALNVLTDKLVDLRRPDYIWSENGISDIEPVFSRITCQLNLRYSSKQDKTKGDFIDRISSLIIDTWKNTDKQQLENMSSLSESELSSSKTYILHMNIVNNFIYDSIYTLESDTIVDEIIKSIWTKIKDESEK